MRNLRNVGALAAPFAAGLHRPGAVCRRSAATQAHGAAVMKLHIDQLVSLCYA